jgi:arsenate reductase (thioredoxin)
MAEGWLRHLAGDRFSAESAGTRPVGLNPYAVMVMKEVGIDLSRQHSKYVEEFIGQRFDFVITVCDRAKESCPLWLGTQSPLIHWSFEDPAAATGSDDERRATFRKIRDQIGERLKDFVNTLGTLDEQVDSQ